MELVPQPAAEAPETFPRFVLRTLRKHWRWLAASAGAQALGYFCRSLPEGVWQSVCAFSTAVIEALRGSM